MIENSYRDIFAFKESSISQAETGATNLTGWILDRLGPRAGDSVLDMGCGTGKRTLPLARIVGEKGYVLAVDRSFESLSTLSQHSLNAGLEARIRFLQINLDEFEGHVRNENFDCALGSRSLYHTRQPRTVFNAIQLALRPRGIFFFYGPSRKDHAELRRFHAELSGHTVTTHENREPTFVEGTGLQCARDFFSNVEIMKFEQPLRFDSPAALHACWSVSKLYNEALEGAFQQAAARHFASYPVFETIQRLVGIRAIK